MTTVTFLRGLPGSGKSTWARQQTNTRIVCRDSIRHMLGQYDDFTSEREGIVTDACNAAIFSCVRRGCDLIIDETHTHPKNPRKVKLLLREFPEVHYTIQDFSDVPLQTCIERCARRHEEGGILIPFDVMERMHKNLTDHPWTIGDLT